MAFSVNLTPGWVVRDSESQEGFQVSNSVDGNSEDYWKPTCGNLRGVCESYRFEISRDGKNWHRASNGSYGNIRNNPVVQEVFITQPWEVKIIRFTALSTVNNDRFVPVAESGIITR